MRFGEFLEINQPILYRSFSRAIKEGRLSHAYLLVGEEGTPLQESAFFLAKSILCDSPSPLADETCLTCTRIDNGNYSDLFFLNGENGPIKKDDVAEIIVDFHRSAIERKGIMIYIVHLVENMTIEAVNSLLKFLEEPGEDTYAILTTKNVSKVLPTIVSRVESIRLNLMPRDQVIKEAINYGVSPQDAELLSGFQNSPISLKEKSESEGYKNAKAAFEIILEALPKRKGDLVYAFEHGVCSIVKDKEGAKFLLNMLSLALSDVCEIKAGRNGKLLSYATLLAKSVSLPHIEASLVETLSAVRDVDSNISIPLIFDHIAFFIKEER